ncbi:MAG: triose-phosphate isomerase [Gammaproteobacteria bacterium]|nr:triose-phosphate isomerase [Gammaproteobacteria bacterium]
MRTKLIMGNWKMNGSHALVKELIPAIQAGLKDAPVDLAICPPYPYLSAVKNKLNQSEIGLGAQDLSSHENGAYTGEVSASMLVDMGCQYVIIGHSERRQYHGETDKLVAEKCLLAHKAGLIPVVCVGETKQQRGQEETEAVVSRQLAAILEACSEQDLLKTIIAYEPVWAIGTGLAATAEQVQAVHAFLRKELAKCSDSVAKTVKILYGGSVKSANADELMQLPDVDGALIGGAALVADEFIKIAWAAATASS